MSRFSELYERLTASSARLVTPSDTVKFPEGAATGGLYTTTAGNVAFLVSGQTIALTAIPAFTRIPIAAERVNATGTTAAVLALF